MKSFLSRFFRNAAERLISEKWVIACSACFSILSAASVDVIPARIFHNIGNLQRIALRLPPKQFRSITSDKMRQQTRTAESAFGCSVVGRFIQYMINHQHWERPLAQFELQAELPLHRVRQAQRVRSDLLIPVEEVL